MKSKLLLMVCLSVISLGLVAQPLNWFEDSPAGWEPVTVMPDFDNFSEGAISAKITFTETGTPYYSTDDFTVNAETAYSFSIDVFDNDPAGECNVRLYFLDAEGNSTRESSDYTVDNADWQTLTITGTTPANTVSAYMVIRLTDVADNWEGSATLNFDNTIYNEGTSTDNLVANGGFELWETPEIPAGSTLMSWYESVPDDFIPIVVEPDVETVSQGFVSAKITYSETGTPYYVSDTFEVTASSSYNFSVDILDNDAGGEQNARIYFIDADGNSTNESTDYTLDNADWQTLSLTGTVPETAVSAYALIRILDVADNWTGSAMFHLDNVRYTEDGGTMNKVPNGGCEQWAPPSGIPMFLTYSFEELDPSVPGVIDEANFEVSAEVPYSTDITSLVATFTMTEGATAQVSPTVQESGVTANDFTNPVTYTLVSENEEYVQDWVVTVTKQAPATGTSIVSFRFEELTPTVTATINNADHTITAEVPAATEVSSLVPTIGLSELATVSPESGAAQDFTNPVTYTVTAQDGSTQDWVVTVTVASAGLETLFYEDFEDLNLIPEDWVIINNDGYTQAEGEERWQDSAWVVTTSSRMELMGTKVAMASSYTSDMPLDGIIDDWMILPAVTIGDNSIISWQAMSTTSSGNYPDDYMVLVAPAVEGGTPTIEYFESEANILIEVKPESWSAGVGNPGEGLASHSVNLNNLGWASQDVWFAFVLNTDLYTNPVTGEPNAAAGGSNLAVDNIKVVNDATSIRGKENTLDVAVYPNPANNKVMMNINADESAMAEIEIINVIGKTVATQHQRVNVGGNSLSIDVSSLKAGIYMISTQVNNKVNVTKLMVK